ncbi:MAG: glycine--tRNA ligase subunit beta [Candidatus Saganbacteria bacterium]|nr:glycine--tRNA ligase subunit beta [Candidatus Saganbacteria bacterium]
MAKTNFLLEIGVEEVPARFLDGVLQSLCENVKKALEERRVGFDAIQVCGTMKRLVLFVEGILEKQQDMMSEVKGPPKKIAFNPDGTATKAALGFAASQDLKPKDLIVRQTNEGEYVYAVRNEKGISTKKVLTDVIPKAILSIHLPISMKWQDGDISFIRPIHYIMAFLGKDPVRFSVGKISASDKTLGHRFLSDSVMHAYNGGADLQKFEEFLEKLGVMLDREKRKSRIIKGIKNHEERTKEKIFADEDLINEVSNIVEYPQVLEGKFDRQFIMVLPQDVIYTVVKNQQKCFPAQQSGSFLIVADGVKEKEIISGYEQVVNARLHDAKFFYDEDVKIPLDKNIEKMKKIVYHEKIGSMWDKTRRIVKLSCWLAAQLTDNKETIAQVERAAELSKADLATHMVGEFSSLAGAMGREYSLVAGEDIRISRAIYEHYLPRFAGDAVPTEVQGAVIGIADRMDSIASCFAADIIPTGSVDPYGLRRAASGIVSIMMKKNIGIPLSKLAEKSMEILNISDAGKKGRIIDFIKQRLKVVLEGEGVRYDVCDSVLAISDDLIPAYCKAFEIMKALEDAWLKAVILAADRINRIVGDAKTSNIDTEAFTQSEERELYRNYCQIKDIVKEHLSGKEYAKALFDYKVMTRPVDVFFEKVLVMHQDDKVRANRLALLNGVKSLYMMFADFSKIVI